MTFAIESRIKSVARTRVTSNSVFSNPRRVRKTAESLAEGRAQPTGPGLHEDYDDQQYR